MVNPFSKYPTIMVVAFAGVGIGVGLGFSEWSPEDPMVKNDLVKWFGLVGDLFIRALKCVVLPLVFVNVILAVIDMMNMGKAGKVASRTLGLYLTTTAIAAIEGLIVIIMFKGSFKVKPPAPPADSLFQFQCSNNGFMTEMVGGAVQCLAESANVTNVVTNTFEINDMGNTFKTNPRGKAQISLSDTIYSGLFTKIVSNNIVGSFNSGNFAAVVLFAIVFGLAASRVVKKGESNGVSSFLVPLLRELDSIFLQLINWIIAITPFAVFSLIVKAIGDKDNIGEKFENVGLLVLSTVIAMALHVFVTYMGLFTLITKSNPLNYLRHIVPAQTMAFACASSAATVPVTLECVKNTRQVPTAVRRFVIPLGATINMDGGAIYFPSAVVFLGVTSGLGDELNFATYLLLILISTIGSAGTAPVPSASLVLILTAYNTVFNTTGEPEGFAFILAVDWFVDRLRTVVNVSGDAMVSRMATSLAGMSMDDDVDEEVPQVANVGAAEKTGL